MQRWCIGAAALLAACGGGSAPAVAPANSSEMAIEQFMRAVADSNLAKMASLWGTPRGSAAETKQPADYERRIVVMQAFLRGSLYRIVGGEPPSAEAQRRLVNVQLTRPDCVATVPFTTVRTSTGGWLVNQIDLDAVGTPGKPCEETAARPAQ